MPDVVVVGAGVVGAATAYGLTEAGAQVTVLDGGQVAGGTSGATLAVDITRVKTPRVLFDLSVASARAHVAAARGAMRLLERARALLVGPPPPRSSPCVGVRPVPPDGLQVVGLLPGLDNLYAVVSHSAVHFAPVLGRLAARELTRRPPGAPGPVRPTRLRPGEQERDAVDESTRALLTRIDTAGSGEPADAHAGDRTSRST
ncbi:MAG: FAD-dependent oxidoreductase [Actinobacteria bacterium]|nr:FAD-dependent oxidoreductase [Actinomycetota bacterium]